MAIFLFILLFLVAVIVSFKNDTVKATDIPRQMPPRPTKKTGGIENLSRASSRNPRP